MKLLFQQSYSLDLGALYKATISTKLFLGFGITLNSACTISKLGESREEIHLEGKELCNSWKLIKVVAIYKTNKVELELDP